MPPLSGRKPRLAGALGPGGRAPGALFVFVGFVFAMFNPWHPRRLIEADCNSDCLGKNVQFAPGRESLLVLESADRLARMRQGAAGK